MSADSTANAADSQPSVTASAADDTDNPSTSVSSVLTRPADEFVNDPNIESLWMTKAVQHMVVYFKLISSMATTRSLRLTKHDDVIYHTFRQHFPQLDVKSLTEDTIKCDEAKAKWRDYCNEMQSLVDDFNFATLMRLDCRQDYSQSNTIVVPKAQFVAIEVARNREGLNDGLNQLFPNN